MPKKILDIGFSDYGRSSGNFAPKDTTIGLDTELVEVKTPFKQIKGIAEDLPFEEDTLDRVTSSYTIGAHSDIQDSIDEILRTLKPRGSAYFTVMVNPKSSSKDEFNKSRLEKYLKTLPITHLRVRSKWKVPAGSLGSKDYKESELVQVSFRKDI